MISSNVIKKYLNNNGIYKGVIIGSQAYTPLLTKNSDIDIIVKESDIPSTCKVGVSDIVTIDGIIEVHVLRDGYALNAIYHSSFSNDKTGDDIIFADILTLFAMKSGHVNRKLIKWDKHMYDYSILKDACIEKYGDEYLDAFVGFMPTKNLIKYAKDHNDMIHGKPFTVPLNVSKEVFFTDGVKKFIEHDYLHEVFAYYHKPMYEMLQKKSQETVFCHRELWEKLTFKEKCFCVLEESYVIASERFIIPAMVKDKSVDIDTLNPCQYAIEALKMVCTTLTGGYFRDFATNNYYDIIGIMDFRYYEKLVPVLNDYYNGVENENDVR